MPRGHKVPPHVLNAIVNTYLGGASSREAVSPFGVDKIVCLAELKKRGIAARRKRDYSPYRLNESYFEKIDSPDKAYWLGFIVADGCVLRGLLLTIGLASVDKPHLAKFLSCIDSDIPIRDHSSTGVLPSGKPHTRFTSSISISSRKMVADLERQGVFSRKSLTAETWNGPDHLMSHYWRGVIDGDGSIVSSGGLWHVKLCATLEMANAFSEWANSICGVPGYIRQNGKIWEFALGGKFAPQKLLEALYSRDSISLDRKQIRAEKIIESECKSGLFGRKVLPWEDVASDYIAGSSCCELASKYGAGHATIREKLRALGVPMRTKGEASRISSLKYGKGIKGAAVRWGKSR